MADIDPRAEERTFVFSRNAVIGEVEFLAKRYGKSLEGIDENGDRFWIGSTNNIPKRI